MSARERWSLAWHLARLVGNEYPARDAYTAHVRAALIRSFPGRLGSYALACLAMRETFA